MEAYKEKLFALCDTIDEKLENIGIASPSLRLIPPRGLPEDQGEGQRPSLLHHPWSRCSPLPLQHYQPRCWFVCVSRVFFLFPISLATLLLSPTPPTCPSRLLRATARLTTPSGTSFCYRPHFGRLTYWVIFSIFTIVDSFTAFILK